MFYAISEKQSLSVRNHLLRPTLGYQIIPQSWVIVWRGMNGAFPLFPKAFSVDTFHGENGGFPLAHNDFFVDTFYPLRGKNSGRK